MELKTAQGHMMSPTERRTFSLDISPSDIFLPDIFPLGQLPLPFYTMSVGHFPLPSPPSAIPDPNRPTTWCPDPNPNPNRYQFCTRYIVHWRTVVV